MHVDLVRAARPLHPLVGACLQLRGVVREALPPPAPLRRRVLDAQPTIALEAGRDEKVALPCGFPEDFGAVPTIEQDVGSGTRDRLKGADLLSHQLDLTPEGHAFGLTGDLLPVQLRRQRTTAPQQEIQTLYQAMADDPLLIGGRVMLAQPLHLLALGLVPRPRRRQSSTRSQGVRVGDLVVSAASGAIGLAPL